MRKISRIIFCSVALIVFISSHIAFADTQKYKIGILAPLTGDFASYGALIRTGIERVQNPAIEWVFEDDACEPAKTVAAYHKLSSIDGISLIIGPACGSPQKAIAPLLKNKKQIVLLPDSASGSVFAASGNKMYSAQYSIDSESTFIANAMNERGLKRVAVVYVENDFSEAHEAAFRKIFKGDIVYSFHAPGFAPSYMKDAALKLKEISFDSIYIPDASPLLLGFLTELHKLGIEKRPVFSVYSAEMKDVLKAEGAQAEGLLYSYPDIPDGTAAVGYFPEVAAKTFAEYVTACNGNYECVAEKFKSNKNFQSDGSLASGIILKTIRAGNFVREK